MRMRRLLTGLFLSISALTSPALAQNDNVRDENLTAFQPSFGQLRHAIYTFFRDDSRAMNPLILRAQFAKPTLPNSVWQIPPSHLRIYRHGEQLRTTFSVPARQRLQFSLNRT